MTNVVSNDLINEKVAEMAWHIIKKDVISGKIYFEIAITCDECDIFNGRTLFIQKYINEKYLDGLRIIKCNTYKVTSYNGRFEVKLQQCDKDESPPQYEKITTENPRRNEFLSTLKRFFAN